MFIWFSLFLKIVLTREIILSSGVTNWTTKQLTLQYNKYSAYANMGIVTASSILVYNLDNDGHLGTYATADQNMSAIEYQISLKKLGLKIYPCLFCDTSIGVCNNLTKTMNKLYSHQQHFINDTITQALKFGWDGYTVDFETGDDKIDIEKFTDFILD